MNVQSPHRLVAIKFSMNADLIPRELGKLKQAEYSEVKFHHGPTGTKLYEEPVPSCSVAELIEELEPQGYEFAGASYERRPDPNGGRKIYHAACYFFYLRDFATPSDEFKKKRYALRQELKGLSSDALWTMRRADDNPLYGPDGLPVDDEHTLEINLNGRQPLVDSNGQLLLVWQDKFKKDTKVPLKAKNELRLIGGDLQIVPCPQRGV